MTLDEAIAQMVNLGESDPLTIARKIVEKNDKQWLAKELVAHSDDFISEMARRQLGAVRRSAELALRPGDQLSSAEMKIAKRWIPGVGWTRVADLTIDDLEKLAAWYAKLANASLKRTHWCREVVVLMKAEGVETLGKLQAALPPLPDDMDELGEAA